MNNYQNLSDRIEHPMDNSQRHLLSYSSQLRYKSGHSLAPTITFSPYGFTWKIINLTLTLQRRGMKLRFVRLPSPRSNHSQHGITLVRSTSTCLISISDNDNREFLRQSATGIPRSHCAFRWRANYEKFQMHHLKRVLRYSKLRCGPLVCYFQEFNKFCFCSKLCFLQVISSHQGK